MEPLLITMDTKPNENSIRFIKTLTSLNWKFKLIGTDTDWLSFLNRVLIYRDELKNIASKTPGRVCIISDCRDVLCVRSPLRFIEQFETFGSNIVVSGELLCGGYTDFKFSHFDNTGNCTPLYDYWKHHGYDLDNLPNRKYVNAGLISGRASDLVEMYTWILKRGVEIKITDDQVLMGMYINENPNKVKIDIDANLLHTSTFGPTAGYLNSFQPKDSPTFAELMGRSAFFLHLPGAGLIPPDGNTIIYDMVSILIDAGYNNNKMLTTQGVKESDIPFGWFKEGI